MSETILTIYKKCVHAIQTNTLIKRVSKTDKEFHYRKMYVVPTPFKLAEGLAHYQTLILPSHVNTDAHFFEVGELTRTEAPELIVGYSFDLQTNEITPQKVPNPQAGMQHTFRAWRIKGQSTIPVHMRNMQQITLNFEAQEDENVD